MIEKGALSGVCHLACDVSPRRDEGVEDNSVLGVAVAVVVVVEDTGQPFNGIEGAAHCVADIGCTCDTSAVLEVHVVCHTETPLPRGHIIAGQLFAIVKRINR